MLFSRKKIRQLNQMLDTAKKPHDLHEVTSAIENTAPALANPGFQKQLRQQLLSKYPTMAAVHKDKKAKHASPSPLRQRGWAFALAALVLVAVCGVASYPLIPAPEVQGYSLKDTLRKISYNAPIKIVFSQMMDQGSVERAFKIEPNVEGTFTWQSNSLVFTPKENFKLGDTFKVSVDKSARSLIQKQLNSDYQENYMIVPAPDVSLFSPAPDSKDVPVDGKLTFHFDRPMIPLTSLDQSNEKAINVKIDPPVEGKAKWLGTSTMSYIPTKLAYATHYTVTIPKGTYSAEGGTTDKDLIYSFDTLKPAFENVSPSDRDPYNGKDTIVKMVFNQPMDIKSAGSFVKFFKYTGDKNLLKQVQWNGDAYANNDVKNKLTTEDVLKKTDKSQWQEVPMSFHYYSGEEYKKDYIQDGTNYYGSADQFQTQEVDIPKIEELQKTLVLTPNAALEEDAMYMVQVWKDFPAAEGIYKLESDSSSLFKTIGALELVSTDPENNSREVSGGGDMDFRFNQAMKQDAFDGKVVIEPKVLDKDGKEQKMDVTVSSDGLQLFVHYPLMPSTQYTVTIKAGAQSIYGKILDKDIVLTFKTAALVPAFSLVSSPDISVLDSTKPRVYYVKSTNIDSLHVEYKKLSPEEFDSFYARGYVNTSFRPADGYSSFDKVVQKDYNKKVVTKIDFDKDFGLSLTPGYYYFEISSPSVFETDYNGVKTPYVEKQVFVVTGTNLATKLSKQQLLVWATSNHDGKPVAGMEIKAKKISDNSVLTGTTDKDGLVTFNLNPKKDEEYVSDFLVTGTLGDDLSITHTTWSDGVSAWNFNLDYSPYTEKYMTYLYTDRPIYRPGHTVYFKGLVRVNDDFKYKLPDRKKVMVAVRDEQAQEVYKKELDLNSNGTFNGEFQLGEQANVGGYTMSASMATADESPYDHTAYQSFRVAAYRKPDYQMTVKPEKDSYANGETAKVKVNGQFFFGAPLANAPVEWTVKGEDYYFFLPADSKSLYASQWFSFSEEGYLCYWGCKGESKVISQGKGKLDANGDFVINLPLSIQDKKLSQIYTIEATASDLNNQTVSSRANLPVHQGDYYVGIMSQNYVAAKGKDTSFDVITIDADGNPVAGRTVEVSLMKREWNTVKKKQVDSDFYYENNYEDVLKEKKTVTTDDKGHATVSFAPQEGGSYKVSSVSTDNRGNKISAATELYVTSGEFVNWGQENNDRIELVPDKQEYKVGDTAHVLIKSPYQNVYALVTHERANVVYKEVIKVTSNSQTIDVPITEESLPNEFVSVLLVKGNNTAAGLQDPGKEVDERDVAAFKMGYTTLLVDTSSRKLGIEVTSDSPKYHPGDEVTLKVKTVNTSGAPVKAEVSLSVVDKSVLSLTENVTADLLTEFYRKRYLGVSTSETLTKALSRLNVQVESGLKGGGGGGVAKRGVFKDTAFWQAVVNTDANGYGEVKFKLPDNLTTWQVMSIGITNDTLVGSQRMDFLVTKDVLARPVLPRFLIVNDMMTVGTIVHNYQDKAMDIDVSLKATGVNITNSDKQRIRLEPGKEQRVDFNISVLDQPESVMTFSAIDVNNNNVGDIVEEKLAIHPFSFPEFVATSAVIDDNTAHVETVWLPTGIDPKFGELKLSAAPTLAGTFAKGIEYLVQFPYGCAEQTASSLLPNLAVKEMAKLPGLGVNKLIDETKLLKNVQAGLQALYKYQQSSGGWGIWDNSTPTPYLTAYVLYTLNEADKAGYTVDKQVMARGVTYLKNSMKDLPLADKNSYNANTRAFALYVLTQTHNGDLGLTNNLYEHKKDLSLFGKAYLAMNMKDLIATAGGSETDLQNKINTLKGEILNVAKETPRGVHFEEVTHSYQLFDTDTRTTALVLQMLSRVDNSNVMIPKILRNMLMEKKDGHYATTQETAITLLAMAEYLKSSKELEPNYNGVITVNNTEKLNGSFTQKNLTEVQNIEIPLKDLLPNNQDNEVAAMKSGSGKMYFDMNLRYFLPTEKIESRDEGIFVNQEYYKMDDKKLEAPVETVKVGDNLVGKMTVIVPEDRYYVMVEDFLPAGLEGVDFNLQTSQQGLQDQMNESGDDGKGPCMDWDCWEEMWRFNHSEVRDDRMMFFADYLPKGVYELKYVVRATSTGTFHDLPAMAQETYFPEVFGRSAGRMFTVLGQ